MSMPRDLVLDTTTLSDIKNEDIDVGVAAAANADYYIPVTQELEFLDGIDDLHKDVRKSIYDVLEELAPERIELDSAPYGDVPFGQGPFGKVSNTYQELLTNLNALGEDDNNSWDVLGAETAIKRDMEFVTRDGNLQDALADYSAEHLLRYEEYKRFVEGDLDC
jgi:predicted nucleic acid-binding protein